MASNASDTNRPVIGLSTYAEHAKMLAWETEFAMLQRAYVRAIAGAGGVPVLLPPVEEGVDEALSIVDGLVLTGGADITPAEYGEEAQPETQGTRADRDSWERRLLDRALALDLPLLCICRGLQMLNVGLGGTLTQHLPAVVGNDLHRPRPGVFGRVGVELIEGSRMAGLLGATVDVPCSHHQAIAKVADPLTPVGFAADGTVEAVEHPGQTFTLGVQWHPEEDGHDLRLFEALVRAAKAPTSPRRGGHDPSNAASSGHEEGAR